VYPRQEDESAPELQLTAHARKLRPVRAHRRAAVVGSAVASIRRHRVRLVALQGGGLQSADTTGRSALCGYCIGILLAEPLARMSQAQGKLRWCIR
jgi:hypothetical protein